MAAEISKLNGALSPRTAAVAEESLKPGSATVSSRGAEDAFVRANLAGDFQAFCAGAKSAADAVASKTGHVIKVIIHTALGISEAHGEPLPSTTVGQSQER